MICLNQSPESRSLRSLAPNFKRYIMIGRIDGTTSGWDHKTGFVLIIAISPLLSFNPASHFDDHGAYRSNNHNLYAETSTDNRSPPSSGFQQYTRNHLAPIERLTKRIGHDFTVNQIFPAIIQVFDQFFLVGGMKRVIWDRNFPFCLIVHEPQNFDCNLSRESPRNEDYRRT